MTIKQIRNDMIQVIVNTEDQVKFGIKYETITYSDGKTRRFCETVLSQAKKDIGFEVQSAGFLIEAKKEQSGIIVLYITSLPGIKNSREEYLCQTVCFSSSDNLLDSLSCFMSVQKNLIYSTLTEYKNKFYLYFELYTTREKANRILRNVLEYSDRTTITNAFLSEHGKCIVKDDAVPNMIKALR